MAEIDLVQTVFHSWLELHPSVVDFSFVNIVRGGGGGGGGGDRQFGGEACQVYQNL